MYRFEPLIDVYTYRLACGILVARALNASHYNSFASILENCYRITLPLFSMLLKLKPNKYMTSLCYYEANTFLTLE